MIDFPQSYTLPDIPNKNEDLDIVPGDNSTIEDCILWEIDDEKDITWTVKFSKRHLTTSWAKVKSQQRGLLPED